MVILYNSKKTYLKNILQRKCLNLTYRKAIPKPSSIFLPHNKDKTANLIFSVLVSNNVGTILFMCCGTFSENILLDISDIETNTSVLEVHSHSLE